MLFLLNDQIVELDSPEARILSRWKQIGCGEPHLLRARDAIAHATQIMDGFCLSGEKPGEDMAKDLAALIVSRTGANAILFASPAPGRLEPRLTVLPEHSLEALRTHYEATGKLDIAEVWPRAA